MSALLAVRRAFGAAAGEPAARKAEAADVANAAGMKQGEATHAGHDMSQMQMGAGSQLVFNPAFGDQIYHTHPSGMWMLSYQYMHMEMGGLRDGASAVARTASGSNGGALRIHDDTDEDDHGHADVDGHVRRHGQLDRHGHAELHGDEDGHDHGHGPDDGPGASAPMSTGGLGDTEVRGIYKITGVLTACLGLSLPTGRVAE